ncbi:hypothetical protein [Methylocella sp. CPCC 101449]|uniref:hypothetical protein n=1 Tax=Methylocella sp. CPCC 101449 TaxID=2987531 RepID=UPI00288F76ED|nr:hypothetical protein [Methylocella sp. CPCC 101449]MDT2022635.1 hypothetical protein [Methylocella sp. CPCC 101449]
MIIEFTDFMWMASVGCLLFLGIAAAALYAVRLRLTSDKGDRQDLSTNRPSQQSSL